MFEHGMSEYRVKMAIWKRESVNACHSKRCIGLLVSSGFILSVTDLTRFEIDSQYLAGRDQLG